MSKYVITTTEQMEAFVQIWKYLSANGKLFIPLHVETDSSSVYAEEDGTGNKIIRAFMDNQAIELYISQTMNAVTDSTFGYLKIGITPVKTLQKKLTEVYGKEQKDDKTVECMLTSYDELGNIQEIDTIWTQTGN